MDRITNLVSYLRGHLGSPPTSPPVANPPQQSTQSDGEGPSDLNRIRTVIVNIEDHGEVQRAFDGVEKVPAAEAWTASDGTARKILFKSRYTCHRAAPDKPSQAASGPVQKKKKFSKKEAECPYYEDAVVFEDEPDVVYTFQYMGHMGHTPGDAEDLRYLNVIEDVEMEVEKLLRAGQTPDQIQAHLHREALAEDGVMEQLANGTFKHPNLHITLSMIENIRRRMAAKTRLDKNDVIAVQKLVDALGPEVVLYYHPQVVEGKEIKEHMRLAICTEVQRSMLKSFGKLIFMDAVFGLSRYGYPMLTLVVRDEYGNGLITKCKVQPDRIESQPLVPRY